MRGFIGRLACFLVVGLRRREHGSGYTVSYGR